MASVKAHLALWRMGIAAGRLMADDKERYMLREDFERALAALMAPDPSWGLVQAIQILGRAQAAQADLRARDGRYDELRRVG